MHAPGAAAGLNKSCEETDGPIERTGLEDPFRQCGTGKAHNRSVEAGGAAPRALCFSDPDQAPGLSLSVCIYLARRHACASPRLSSSSLAFPREFDPLVSVCHEILPLEPFYRRGHHLSEAMTKRKRPITRVDGHTTCASDTDTHSLVDSLSGEADRLEQTPTRCPQLRLSPPAVEAVPSPRQTGTMSWQRGQTLESSSPDASIVLLGARGCGKSCLALIAATGLRRRLIDSDEFFYQHTGHSRLAFKRERGMAEYRLRDAKVTRSMLLDHSTGYIIVCNPGSVERSGQVLLREYAKTHPVIHVIRDPQSIQKYLDAWKQQSVLDLLRIGKPIYQGCSNFEFYNLPENFENNTGLVSGDKPCIALGMQGESSLFLRLKSLEQDFLRFLAAISGRQLHCSDRSTLHTLSPLSSSTYSYALSIPMSVLEITPMRRGILDCCVDAFELVIDAPLLEHETHDLSLFLAESISQQIAALRRYTTEPIIYHVEKQTKNHGESLNRPEGNQWPPIYADLLFLGLRLAPEYLTVDLEGRDEDLAMVLKSRGATRIIGHYHDSSPGPAGWDSPERWARYERARRIGCHVIRFTQPAQSMEDNFAVLRFIHRIESLPFPQPQLIAYNTGTLGRISASLNRFLTSVTTPEWRSQAARSRRGTRCSACLTLNEVQQALHTAFIMDPLRFYLLGPAVSHSLSPEMNSAAYKALGMPHEFEIREVSSLECVSDIFENPNFGGASLNRGYRLSVIPMMYSMSDHAKTIGAVNTVIPIRTLWDADQPAPLEFWRQRHRAGPIKGLYGDNTDWIGIESCVRRCLSPANAVTRRTTGLVIGAGGMARAAIYAMIQLGIRHIFIHNRTLANAENLADHYNSQSIDSRGSGRTTLLNTSRVGREPWQMVPIAVMVLETPKMPWPSDYEQPTVIANCIPAPVTSGTSTPHELVPPSWLESPTGGVVLDVRWPFP